MDGGIKMGEKNNGTSVPKYLGMRCISVREERLYNKTPGNSM